MRMRSYYVLFVLFVFCGVQLFGQQKKTKLQEKNNELKLEISKLNKELEKNKKDKNNVIIQYKVIEKKIASRKQIISNLNQEIAILDDEIYLTQLDINKLRREMSSLVDEYRKVVIKSYKNKSLQNKISFIFSSKSLSQAFKRAKYLQKYSDYQNKQADEIQAKQNQIQTEKLKKENKKREQTITLGDQKIESGKLEVEINEQQKILTSFKAKEAQLKLTLAKKRNESKKLDREIQRIIVEEIRLAKIKAAEEKRKRIAEQKKKLLLEEEERKKAAQKSAKNSAEKREVINTYKENIKKIESKVFEENTKEVDLVSDRFESNKGRLPWPVEKGTITGGFGVTNHPILTNLTIENSGIDISTNAGTNARAVFEGIISAIYSIPGGGKAVLIQHGDYFTVYNNLVSVFVKKGDKVSLKQSIGKIYTDNSTGNTVLNFQVWKEVTKLNPSNWIVK